LTGSTPFEPAVALKIFKAAWNSFLAAFLAIVVTVFHTALTGSHHQGTLRWDSADFLI